MNESKKLMMKTMYNEDKNIKLYEYFFILFYDNLLLSYLTKI